jgi:hypothetical protein
VNTRQGYRIKFEIPNEFPHASYPQQQLDHRTPVKRESLFSTASQSARLPCKGKSNVSKMNQFSAQPVTFHDPTESWESRLVWDYFKQRSDGVFVECGANPPVHFNQTWFLEQQGCGGGY